MELSNVDAYLKKPSFSCLVTMRLSISLGIIIQLQIVWLMWEPLSHKVITARMETIPSSNSFLKCGVGSSLSNLSIIEIFY